VNAISLGSVTLNWTPPTENEDGSPLMDLAGYREALPFSAQTCLRINISWHVYMPACSTTPWQMHGVIQKLKADGYDLSPLGLADKRTDEQKAQEESGRTADSPADAI